MRLVVLPWLYSKQTSNALSKPMNPLKVTMNDSDKHGNQGDMSVAVS
jgi:hypothetical protein